MIGTIRTPLREDEASPYASREDFSRIFTEDMSELYQLSFLLTGDHAKAEECFVSGIGDCVGGNAVFRDWALSWAKRAIIQNAIREIKPRPSPDSSLSSATFSPRQSSAPDEPFVVSAILGLKDFERFLFVMSVLERYSERNCALLLGCAISEVRDARGHALQDLAAAHHAGSFMPQFSGS